MYNVSSSVIFRSLNKIVSKFLNKTVSQYPDNNAPQPRKKFAMTLFLKSFQQEDPLKIYPDKLVVTVLLHNHNNPLAMVLHNHNNPLATVLHNHNPQQHMVHHKVV